MQHLIWSQLFLLKHRWLTVGGVLSKLSRFHIPFVLAYLPMSLDFATTDTRTRRFTNAGNSCYINATLQALFAVPPVQRLYGEAGLNRHLSGGCKRDDGQIDGDVSIAITYREARLASKRLDPMFPQAFLDNFYDGTQDDASVFSNSFRTVIVVGPLV